MNESRVGVPYEDTLGHTAFGALQMLSINRRLSAYDNEVDFEALLLRALMF